MKRFTLFALLSIFTLSLNAQVGFLPTDLKAPAQECFNCPRELNYYPSGHRAGIGFGLAWEIAEKLDLTTNLGLQVWDYSIKRYGLISLANPWPFDPNFSQLGLISEKEKTQIVLNFSVGQRFHFFTFSNSSIFFATNFNAQYNPKTSKRTFALSIEPAIGWKKVIGQKWEYFVSVGYDKFLTSFEWGTPVHPGSVALNMGFKINIKKGTKTIQ